ncbi:hypothetical protein RJ640_027121 [Escallonia rubra]|uniref:Flap endonuclease GEN-like 1 n=1 Tax=Escallonia rubra TaxID=112253 RepID=A0AA88U8E5_9ASTE|nr:hypothetical protein RJ640_027121 [Escallonia rubra]
MGVGGHFWDLLKPYSKNEGPDFLRDKRVAVDLSYWIVQQETAVKTHIRNPHIRLTFFRTINLFAKFGAFPVFVVDGTPSPLKSQARIARFFRLSGIDSLSLPVAEEGVSVERNGAFQKCIKEGVELLELLGMPVLKARGEAEALCAQLNREGQVHACITADSDSFLFGAECTIKHIRPNCKLCPAFCKSFLFFLWKAIWGISAPLKEPFECYHMSDIEAGLGLKREHLIAISLLIGNDHDLNGVRRIGLDTALRFVKSFSEDEILNRLHEIGRGNTLQFEGSINYVGDFTSSSDKNSRKAKLPHCSFCGHPGSKRDHLKFACEYCNSSKGCIAKPVCFKCDCPPCDLVKRDKVQQKEENWQMKVCKRIAMEQNFPNDEIIEMYLNKNKGNYSVDDGLYMSWENPKTETLIDYLAYYQQWQPSYIRQRMLPMLSTIFLREMALNSTNDLLYGQYEFDSVQRVKIRYGCQCYVVKWKKASNAMHIVPSEGSDIQAERGEHDESSDLSDEPDAPHVHEEEGCLYLSTDEHMELVRAAFPEKVKKFLKEKEVEEQKSRWKRIGIRSEQTPEKSESTTVKSVQLSITEFYRSSKLRCRAKPTENVAKSSESSSGSSKGKRTECSPNLSKSARRRLLFG